MTDETVAHGAYDKVSCQSGMAVLCQNAHLLTPLKEMAKQVGVTPYVLSSNKLHFH